MRPIRVAHISQHSHVYVWLLIFYSRWNPTKVCHVCPTSLVNTEFCNSVDFAVPNYILACTCTASYAHRLQVCTRYAQQCTVAFFIPVPLMQMFTCRRTRDVPDIRFRLAGYTAIFSNPVPAPVPAKMVPDTGYLSRIVLSPFCAFRASLQHCRRSHY